MRKITAPRRSCFISLYALYDKLVGNYLTGIVSPCQGKA